MRGSRLARVTVSAMAVVVLAIGAPTAASATAGFDAAEPPVAPDDGSNVATFTEESPPQLVEKQGGVTSTDPDDPSITITEWPGEGLARLSNGPYELDHSGEVVLPAAGSWYCEIQIPTPQKVVGGLQWGGSATCDGDHTPSWVIVSLEDTCDGAFCFVWETKRGPYRSAYSQDYGRLKSVSQITPCNTSGNRKIRAKVELYVRGGVHQDTRTYPEWVYSCHIY